MVRAVAPRAPRRLIGPAVAQGKSGVAAYADGSCLGNPGPGGWGVLIVGADGSQRELSGADPSTTNNRMEITAAVQALRALPPGLDVTIHSDSQYLINTMTRGWRRRENLDLWRELDAEAAKRRVQWEWVRGHAGDPLNERADELARSAAMGKRPAAAAPRAPGRSIPRTVEAGEKVAVDAEAEMLRQLRELLGENETIRRCANCGRAFVAAADDSHALTYCDLAPCQLAARRARD